MTRVTTLILPGWQDSGPNHWQSLWQAAHGYIRVQQHDWQRPLRGDWCAQLESHVANLVALQKTEQSKQQIHGLQATLLHENACVILVAHSLGCHLVAAWAAASRHTSAIRGALLVAPPDLTQADLPHDMYGWRKPVLQALPFAATCVVSSNDPFCSLSSGQAMATAWGARCLQAGPLGHINSNSNLGDWAQGQVWLADLCKT